MAVETHLSAIGKIRIPQDALPGTYSLEVEMKYPQQKALKASENFRVIEIASKKEANYELYVLALIAMISLLVIFAIYLLYKLIKIEENVMMYGKR